MAAIPNAMHIAAASMRHRLFPSRASASPSFPSDNSAVMRGSITVPIAVTSASGIFDSFSEYS